ncbi:group II intron reverse transcriptase/maturase [Frankia saprophytica]|uniref:group II intron reverse transcriptase/maturase n=1 Tax=Pseudofrankia saprophytica TaxID=298655 RepID=UPI000234BCAC
MPEDASLDGGAPRGHDLTVAAARVSGMQAKLHRWAAADPGRRFDDLYNFVCDPATLLVAYRRVAGNRGARTAGVDGLTVADVDRQLGVSGFLDDLRSQLKAGTFRPLPVRERVIPKPGGAGKIRRLGIPTVADRVVQAALKLVLEPIFDTDFLPVSYGFRPGRRAQDAIAEIHMFGTKGYRWVLDADIHACFDEINHGVLMDRVRKRIKDKRVLALVKAFLKAGILTELGEPQNTRTGVPQGGILSPLLANIALSVLDEHLHGPWQPGGAQSTQVKRAGRRKKGLPRWRLVRYADDFVVLVNGNEHDAQTLREEVVRVLTTMGLRLSEAKTQVTHLDRGFDFLGFRIQRRRKRGTDKWYVYTFVADRAIRAVKAKIRAMTPRESHQGLEDLLTWINRVTHGWAGYFKHAVAKHVFSAIDSFVWWRLARLLMTRHRWRWKEFRARYTTPTGRWLNYWAGTTEWKRTAKIPVTRYRYRGTRIPTPWAPQPA